MAGTTMVLNGRQMWVYNPSSNTYTEMTLPDPEDVELSPDEMPS